MKNIVFDVGMVLVDFRWKEYMRDIGFTDDDIDFMGKKMVMNPLWNELDLGIMNEKDVVDMFKKDMPGYEDKVDKFWENPLDLVEEFDYAGPMIKKLKKAGYSVYLLSNYPKTMYELHWPRFTFYDELDGKIVSAVEKMAKPDENIYKLLLDRYNLEPKDTCFIDDRQINIDAANNMGITGILFEGYGKLVEELRGYNVMF